MVVEEGDVGVRGKRLGVMGGSSSRIGPGRHGRAGRPAGGRSVVSWRAPVCPWRRTDVLDHRQ